MATSAAEGIHDRLAALDPVDVNYASWFVEKLLAAALEASASDVHLQPAPSRIEVRWRLDGVMQRVGRFPRGEKTDVVSRLKVLADLLTYRSDIPQEGRIRDAAEGTEMRVSTFPTLHGERAVVRLFASDEQFHHLADLSLPDDVSLEMTRLLTATSGGVVITGPAGSGKTTTAYACLRELARSSGDSKSIVTLEDPIEVAVDGVSQSQVNEASGFNLTTGLRSLMRQDPEIILVGEIRDPATAEIALQACLTGHLVFTTFHAGSAAAAINRLSDMGIEPYLLRSGLLAILSQRLVRRLCDCKQPARDPAAKLGLPVSEAHVARGCGDCLQSGFRGRMVLAELLTIEPTELGRAILSRSDSNRLEQLARESGMITLLERACAAVEQGRTTPAEVRRVFGTSSSMQTGEQSP